MSPCFTEPINDFDIVNPHQMISDYREEIRRTEDKLFFLDGKIESIKEGKVQAESRYMNVKSRIESLEIKQIELSKLQFDGIDIQELTMKRSVLEHQLANEQDSNQETGLALLREKLKQTKQRQDVSPFRENLAQLDVQINSAGVMYKSIKDRAINARVGNKCPTCYLSITPENLVSVQTSLKSKLDKIHIEGSTLAAERKELRDKDGKAKQAFENQRGLEIMRLTEQVQKLETSTAHVSNRGGIINSINEIDDKLRLGNLSEEQHNELASIGAEMMGYQAELKAMENAFSEQDLEKLEQEKATLNSEIIRYRNVIVSLAEFIAKLTELALEHIKMPNVSIKLYEVVRSTGELKNVFKFTYKGIDYSSLSFSQKTLAGIEIAAMIRAISGIDCPIFIDNAESIVSFNHVPMPTQTFLMKVAKGQSLTIRSISSSEQLKKVS